MYMCYAYENPKIFGIDKRNHLKINKNNKKKVKYANVKSNQNPNKTIRTHTSSKLQKYINEDKAEDFLLPTYTTKHTTNWWDGSPLKIKIFNRH